MRFGSTAEVLAECTLKNHRISVCGKCSLLNARTWMMPDRLAARQAADCLQRMLIASQCTFANISGEHRGYSW